MLGEVNYSTGGYNCAFCGANVMHNTFHSCNVQPYYQGTYAPTVVSQDTEIIERLDKIIDLLEGQRQDKAKEDRDALDAIEREFGVKV